MYFYANFLELTKIYRSSRFSITPISILNYMWVEGKIGSDGSTHASLNEMFSRILIT
jgi:hypothetical protein